MADLKALLGLTVKGLRPAEHHKHHFPGCVPFHGDHPTYSTEANGTKLTNIPVEEVTGVKAEPIRGCGKRVASNERLRCYAMKTFIRVVDNPGEHRVLLRGHDAPVIDISVRAAVPSPLLSVSPRVVHRLSRMMSSSVSQLGFGHTAVAVFGWCGHGLAFIPVAKRFEIRCLGQSPRPAAVSPRCMSTVCFCACFRSSLTQSMS